MIRCVGVSALLTMVLITGCGLDWTAILGQNTETGQAKLERFASANELKQYLVSQASPTNKYGVFAPTPTALDAAEDDASQATAGGASNEFSSDGESRSDSDAPDYSSTTEQEEGVHEADVVKTDGEYLYILSDGILNIVDAVPADSMATLSTTDVGGWGNEMYLVGNQVVTITEPDSIAVYAEQAVDSMFAPGWYFEQTTVVTVIDASDPADPVVKSRTEIDGWVNTSRMIGTVLYLVVTNDLGFLDYDTTTELDTATKDADLSAMLPDIVVEEDGTETVNGDLTTYEDYYRPVDADGLGMTSIITMDINSPADYDAQTVVGYPSNTYVSTEALYLTDSDYTYDGEFRETTDIYKFAFSGATTSLVAAGTVPGRVLNQYSMSEHNGYLRIATTVWSSGGLFTDGSPSNAVYILQQNGTSMEKVGTLEGLAPGETIYSARFLGDKGYLVTFEQIDPLFTLDLSDPTNPKAVGELKVPGFSTLILPMGDDHLLTIGRDTSEEFGWAFADGIRLSIFDVSDFANPQLAYHEVLGSTGTWSEALYNPKAFTYFSENDLIAFPAEMYEWGEVFFDERAKSSTMTNVGITTDTVVDAVETTPIENVTSNGSDPDDATSNGTEIDDVDSNGDEPTDVVIAPPTPSDYFVGLYVYRATTDNGFEYVGRISTATDSEYCYYCSPSFTRGVFIGDNVYAATSEGVQSAAVDEMDSILSDVEFTKPEDEQDVPNSAAVAEPPRVPLPTEATTRE